MREFMNIVEGALPNTVYHGTIMRKWESPAGGTDGGILFLTNSRDEAESYADQAYEQGCTTELSDDGEFPYDAGAAPVIISFDFAKLLKTPGLEFDHDWGWHEAPEGATWQQSLAAVGSFVMTGFTEAHKSLARVELAYPEYHAEQANPINESTTKDGREIHVWHEENTQHADLDYDPNWDVYAAIDGKVVGSGWFTDDHFNGVDVNENYRRLGVASAIYDYVESLGFHVRPSPNGQEPDGEAFWAARKD